jgi:uncharacterized delta-60 repeat protein
MTTFGPGIIYSLSAQSDNKIIVGGKFSLFDGNSVSNICRLNADGSFDESFETGAGFNGPVNATLVRPDGKIVVGGDFTEYDGNAVFRIALLNEDGSWNEEFTLNDGLGLNGPVHALALQSDGKIVVGGDFSTFDFFSAYNITRLNSDGSADVVFDLMTGFGFTGPVYSVAVQSDGKIIAGGNFLQFNTAPSTRIARLNNSGSIDGDFTTNIGGGANNVVYGIAVQPDQKIISVGSFSSFTGVSAGRVVRLHTDGTRDTAFTTNTGVGLNGVVTSVAVQSDGKIVVGGSFTASNGATANQVARFNVSGTPDTEFNTNIGRGANSVVFSVLPRSTGDIFVGGDFNFFDYFGWVDFTIARRYEDALWKTVL